MREVTTPASVAHPSGLDPNVVAKVVARRGRLHAFEALEARRSALVVIDLNRASVEQDVGCQIIVPRINAVATALRQAGGTVAWVRTQFHVTPNAIAIFGSDAARFAAELDPTAPGAHLWPELAVDAADLHALKQGFSAFFPGKCDLHDRLAERGIEHVLIAGTVTNVCCDSSARDACELGYRVTMISDACAGHWHGLHEAALATFYRCFGDVRPAADVIELCRRGDDAEAT